MVLLLPGQTGAALEEPVGEPAAAEDDDVDELVMKVLLAGVEAGAGLELTELVLTELIATDDEDGDGVGVDDVELLLLVSDVLLVEVEAGGGTKMGDESANGELLVSTDSGAPKYSSSIWRVLICRSASAQGCLDDMSLRILT